MSLAARLSKPPVNTDRQYCEVGRVLDFLEKTQSKTSDDFLALEAALSDSKAWPATELAKALDAEGSTVNVRHVREHRRGHDSTACAYPEIR